MSNSKFVILYLVSALILGGCAVSQQPPVPGIDESANKLEPIDEAIVLSSLKCQLARGFLKVEEMKRTTFSDNKAANGFEFVEGSGTFSGKVQFVGNNGATLSAIIPFSGFDGTIATPTAGRQYTSTSVQEVKRTFDIDPTVEADDLALCDSLMAQNVEVGSFLSDAIEGVFLSTVGQTTKGNGIPFGPTFTSSQIDLTTSFTVSRKDNGGISIKFIPTSSNLDEIVPGVTVARDRSDVYTLTTKLPTQVGAKADSRRLHFCVDNPSGDSVCVEEPYSDRRYEELKDTLISGIEKDAFGFELDFSELNELFSNQSELESLFGRNVESSEFKDSDGSFNEQRARDLLSEEARRAAQEANTLRSRFAEPQKGAEF